MTENQTNEKYERIIKEQHDLIVTLNQAIDKQTKLINVYEQLLELMK